MQNLKIVLKDRLSDARRIAILGVGSELRADDAAGVFVAGNIKKWLRSKRKKRIKVFIGHSAPENITGEIRNFKPDHLLVIDSADIRKRAGSVALIDSKNLSLESFSTHKFPLYLISRYLSCEATFIGVQPKSLKFLGKISNEASVSIKKLTAIIKEVLNSIS